MKGCVLLTAFLLSLGATRSARTTCGNSCIPEVCGSYGLSPRCLTIESPQPSLSTCNCSNYLVHCGGDLSGTSSLLTQQFGSSLCGTGSLNQSLSTGDSTSFISNGFYIFRNPRFCENGCFKSFSFHTDGFNNSQEGSRELLRIHIFTRYEVEEVRRQGQFTGDVFLEHTSFNVPLFLQVGSSDVVEADVTDQNFCFKREDYFGLSVKGNLRIRAVGPGQPDVEGVWRNNNFPIDDETCNTNRSIIELSNSLPEASGNRPVMTIILKDSSIISTDTLPSIGSSTESDTEPEATSSSDLLRVSSEATSELAGGSVTDSILQPPADNSILILGVVIPIILVLLVALVVVAVLSFFYAKHVRRSHKIQTKTTPEIQRLDGLSMVSMNSTNATYHDTPLIHYSPDRVTVVNPHADDEVMGDLMTHDYHEPYEINGANARSRRQPPPPYSKGQVMAANQVEIPDTVANVLYGDPSALFGNYPPPPSSPTYQEPDALAVQPLQRRGTIQNTLYSTTEEFGVRTNFAPSPAHSNTAAADPIYNVPFELGKPPNSRQHPDQNSPFARPRLVPAVRAGVYDSDFDSESVDTGSRDSLNNAPSHLALEYSLPVIPGEEKLAKSPASQLLVGVSHGVVENHQSGHMLGVVESGDNNHHYHLLDDKMSQGGYTTDDDEAEGSSAHHIVDQLGAYVPNSEERRDLYKGDTLQPTAVESWKKSSFKKGKFFVRQEKFWVPSQNKAILFDQLSQKKFREIFKDHLAIKSHIGSGQFGSVQKAKLKCPSGEMEVAVKIMKPSALEDAPVKFLQEAAIMGQFFHPNIIELFGIVTLNKPLMIVMEYMPLGDLRTYLVKHYRSVEAAAPPQSITLLKFCRQVVQGMCYLAKKHFVHRDLAARNVFVSSTLECKIGDFGMSRNLMDEEYYKSHGGVVPIKWTAPEGLVYKKYSSASDVYSYGMTIFEIWSLGEKPLRDIPLQNVVKTIEEGYCQPPPPGTPREIYKVMVQCWNPKHLNRASFNEVSKELMKEDDVLLSWEESDPDIPSAAKVIGSPLQDGYVLHRDLQNTYNPASSEMAVFRESTDSINMYKV